MKKYGLAVIGLVILVLFCTCITSVPTGHTGVLTTFGKVDDRYLDAGFHLKAPWQSVKRMDNRIQKATEALSCFSSDIQEVEMLYTMNFQIDPASSKDLYANVGKYYYVTVVYPAINEATKVCTAKFTAEELVENRSELAESVKQELERRLEKYQVSVVDGVIENLDFSDAFTDAVEAKQVAEQNKLRAKTEADQKIVEANAAADVKKIEADAEAYQLQVRAEAEAEANEKLSKSLTSEILTKMYYDNWDGVLPSVITDGNTLLNLPVDATESAESK